MRSKDRIIIQKIIRYIEDVEEYIEGIEAIDFLDDKKSGKATLALLTRVFLYVTFLVVYGKILYFAKIKVDFSYTIRKQ